MSRPDIVITIETTYVGDIRRDRFWMWADTFVGVEESCLGTQEHFDPAELRGRVAERIERHVDALERRHPHPQEPRS